MYHVQPFITISFTVCHIVIAPLCTPFYSGHLLLAPVSSFVLNHRNQSLTTDGLGSKTPDVYTFSSSALLEAHSVTTCYYR